MKITGNEVRISAAEAADQEKFTAAFAEATKTSRLLVVEPAGDVTPTTVRFEDPIHISTKDARDSAKYRFARASAEKEGRKLVIDPPVVETITPAAGTVMIPRDASPQEYRRMKADAESRGVPFMIQS